MVCDNSGCVDRCVHVEALVGHVKDQGQVDGYRSEDERNLGRYGHRFELYPSMLGNPDFAHRRMRIVVFCNGDFWHVPTIVTEGSPDRSFGGRRLLRTWPRSVCHEETAT